MLFQDFVGSIIGAVIGSFLATIGSVLVWLIIEKLKKSKPKRILKRNINKLYEEFAKKKIEPFMTIRMSTLIEDIGKKKLMTKLKLTLQETRDTLYVLMYEDIGVTIINGATQHEITIRYGKLSYNYEKPEENPECLQKFLKFYEEQCKLEKIKLKKPK